MSLQKLIEKLKGTAEYCINGKLTYAGIDPTDLIQLCQAAEVMREALKGEHDGCHYLAMGVCNKCGALVNHWALSKADKICEG